MSTGTEGTDDVVARLTAEGLEPLAQAAKACGVVKHTTTFPRWHYKGCPRRDGRVVRLECLRVGRSLMTSRAAIHRFVSELSGTSEPGRAATPTPRSAAKQSRASEHAGAELERLGL